MKIAIIVPSLSNKGPVIVARELCRHYMSKSHQCQVFYFDDITELEFPCSTTRIKYTERIDFNNFNIVHSHTLKANCYVWYFKPRFKKMTTKFISTLHQPLTFTAMRMKNGFVNSIILSFLDKLSQTRMDINVVLSREQYELSIDSLNKEKTVIIHNGRSFDRNEISNKNDKENLIKLKQKYKIIGSVSVIIPRKGLEQIVKAMPYLKEYALVLVGEGSELERIQNLSIELNVSERCLFLGYRSDAENYYPYFDIFVMCTRSEGFPLSFIEAAAFGIPTVLSNISILRSIVREEDTAIFYKLDDINSLVESIEKCYHNRINLSNNIKNYYERYLTAEIMAENYLKLYETVINK